MAAPSNSTSALKGLGWWLLLALAVWLLYRGPDGLEGARFSAPLTAKVRFLGPTEEGDSFLMPLDLAKLGPLKLPALDVVGLSRDGRAQSLLVRLQPLGDDLTAGKKAYDGLVGWLGSPLEGRSFEEVAAGRQARWHTRRCHLALGRTDDGSFNLLLMAPQD